MIHEEDEREETLYQYMIQEVKNHKLMWDYNFSNEECDLLIKVLEKAEKYRWHDLQKDLEDLPNIMEQVLLKVQIGYDEYEYITGSRVIGNDNGWTCFGDPVAWKYIDPYDEIETYNEIEPYDEVEE